MSFVREVSSYWCRSSPRRASTTLSIGYYEFLEYGDAGGYRTQLAEFRDRLRG